MLCIQYLHINFFKTIFSQKWKILNNDITVKLNTTKDNVRHLSMIERFWDPLYRSEPPEVAFNIPSLLTTIRSVYKTSHFYNTSERITGFLVKVTSQIIIACQNYLTYRRQRKIWDQDKLELLKRIDVRIDIYFFSVKCLFNSPLFSILLINIDLQRFRYGVS